MYLPLPSPSLSLLNVLEMWIEWQPEAEDVCASVSSFTLQSLDLWTEAKDSVSELRVIRKLLLALARVNRSEKTDALRARAVCVFFWCCCC